MTIRKIIRYAMLATPFLGLAAFAWINLGWFPVLVIFGGVALLYGWLEVAERVGHDQ